MPERTCGAGAGAFLGPRRHAVRLARRIFGQRRAGRAPAQPRRRDREQHGRAEDERRRARLPGAPPPPELGAPPPGLRKAGRHGDGGGRGGEPEERRRVERERGGEFLRALAEPREVRV